MSVETAVAPMETTTTTLAPDVAPTPVETQAPPEQTQPMTRSEAKAAMMRDLVSSRPVPTAAPEVSDDGADPAAPTQERVRDASGRFTSPEATEPPIAEGRPADISAEAPVADERPAAHRRVVLPADHPIRGMGLDALTASSPHEEQAIRALINGTYARRQELEAQAQRAERAEQELMRLRAEMGARTEFESTPEYQQALRQREELASVDEKAAERYWKGVQSELEEAASRQLQKLTEEYTEQQVIATARAFVEDVQVAAVENFPTQITHHPRFSDVFDEVRHLYGAALERRELRGEAVVPDRSEFLDLLKERLIRHPEIRVTIEAAMRAEQLRASPPQPQAPPEIPLSERERIEREAIERFKRESAHAVPPHPMGALAGAARPQPLTAGQAPAPDTSGLSPSQLRRSLREASINDGRARVHRI
jgi:hypothetical protein